MDQKVESLEGFKLKCFLDAYKGYHQIRMAREDEEKMPFHTEHETFCYEKMPFGLKNAGATYQRLTDNMFARHLGRNIEIYVDDMVIKIKSEGSLIADITETFNMLKKANMKLNPKKCTFGVESGQFLGTLREVQALNGKLAALGRFLAKSAERSLPFFKTLKGCLNKKDFRWNAKAEAAFQELKSHLQSLPTLTVPKPGETLILYLAAATEAIGAVLLTER
ncbi:reverse transcriptase domain-containing protein [Tanacetum coccineum]